LEHIGLLGLGGRSRRKPKAGSFYCPLFNGTSEEQVAGEVVSDGFEFGFDSLLLKGGEIKSRITRPNVVDDSIFHVCDENVEDCVSVGFRVVIGSR
jgi:hypothetical protein